MIDNHVADLLRDAGLMVLLSEVRRRLRAGVHPDAVVRWFEAEMVAASQRLDAVERGEFFRAETP